MRVVRIAQIIGGVMNDQQSHAVLMAIGFLVGLDMGTPINRTRARAIADQLAAAFQRDLIGDESPTQGGNNGKRETRSNSDQS